MISAMAPQHGSPPLNYKPGAVTTTLVPCAHQDSSSPSGGGHHSASTSPHLQSGGYVAGHPSFQAQHHRQGVANNPMVPAQQQYGNTMQQHPGMSQEAAGPYNTEYVGSGNPAEMVNGGYQQQPYAARGNNNPLYVVPSMASSSSAEPVIADLDQLQQQQRQQQQICKTDVLGVVAQQQTSNVQVATANETEQQQQRCNNGGGLMTSGVVVIGEELPGSGDMMDGHELHSPLDGSDHMPPLMDGESPPGSLQEDSPLYPWMRSQFGNFFLLLLLLFLVGKESSPPLKERKKKKGLFGCPAGG